ncbi:MAG: carbohydrate ABC transporter permease [Acutalibacteraceae bacterium]|jgi:putative aldouronate transport system permease protein
MKESIHISSTRGDRIFTVINGLIVGLFTIVTLYPLIYVLSASISSPDAVNGGQMWLWPVGINTTGYARVFRDPDIWTGYRNTIFYTFFGTLISLAITLPCAYALTVKKLPGRKLFNGLFLFTMFFGGGIIPLYLLLKDLHILNTIWAVLLPPAASIWNIIITRTFFESSIPPGLEEAAEIDGCNVFQKFFRIILPLSAPIIAVMALFYGVGRWNSYFNEMMFLRNSALYPLQVFLRELLIVTQINASNTTMGSEELKTMAEQAKLASIMKYSIMIVATLPVIIIYPFLQRYFVKGVMVGSIKG